MSVSATLRVVCVLSVVLVVSDGWRLRQSETLSAKNGASSSSTASISHAQSSRGRLLAALHQDSLNGNTPGLFRFKSQHRDTLAAHQPLSVPEGSGSCFDLVESMCVPCPSPEQNNCEAVSATCNNLFCSPMCLSNTFTCKVEGEKDMASITDPEKQALCGQIIGHACSSTYGCCKDSSPGLLDWVEGLSMDYGKPLLPVAACRHDPKDSGAADLACNRCKAQLSFEFKPSLDQCKFGSEKLPEGGESQEGVGAMKSYQERCLAETRKVMAQVSSVYQAITPEQLCVCAGCCAPTDGKTCFFPLTNII